MRPPRRTLLVVIALAVLVALAGCGGDGASQAPADAPPAAALQANATSVMQNVSTAQLTMDMSIDTGDQVLALDATGRLNRSSRRLRMETQVSGPRDATVTQYIVGETAYQRVDGRWRRQDVSDQDPWGDGNQLAVQREAMANADISITGRETVNGHDVWVVSIDADRETVQEVIAQSGSGVSDDVAIDDVTLTQYVDVETAHVRKLEMDMEATVSGQSATLDMTMTFSAFDEPVTIELPAEAR